MNKKKLLLVTPDFPPKTGGVARYLGNMSEYVSDEIEVLADPHPQWHTTDTKAAYPIYRSALLYKWVWPRWFKLVQFLRRHKDRYRKIIVSHVLPVGTAAWTAARTTKTPYIVILHGMDLRLALKSAKKRRLAQKVVQGAETVVANSRALAEEIAQTLGRTDVLVVYPCVTPIPNTEARNHQRLTFITVSRLVERKGHTDVINALGQLKAQGLLPEFTYHVVGEGPMESSIRSLIESLNLEDEVVLHGPVSDEKKHQLISQSDLFLMPVSKDPVDKEGFGIVYIEAAQHGVPSIGTNIPGVDEAVLHGETGILIEEPSSTSVAQAIITLVKDPELRQRLGTNAKHHAEQFSCERQFATLKPYL